ncbi:MAG: hypothetical protein MZV70_64280 [Desulfobacterales bacterium]|nr:hypothetical protein [Desulfobacterales bacterium]
MGKKIGQAGATERHPGPDAHGGRRRAHRQVGLRPLPPAGGGDADQPWQTYRILYEDLPPREALYQLMTRDLKPELDDD